MKKHKIILRLLIFLSCFTIWFFTLKIYNIEILKIDPTDQWRSESEDVIGCLTALLLLLVTSISIHLLLLGYPKIQKWFWISLGILLFIFYLFTA